MLIENYIFLFVVIYYGSFLTCLYILDWAQINIK